MEKILECRLWGMEALIREMPEGGLKKLRARTLNGEYIFYFDYTNESRMKHLNEDYPFLNFKNPVVYFKYEG